ncbi:unnamed protein product [Amoebophrya sp. A120]|nr:unnamed protein product [Amoebophrya sp. A120]|eukprot:GSA120T00019315001.1
MRGKEWSTEAVEELMRSHRVPDRFTVFGEQFATGKNRFSALSSSSEDETSEEDDDDAEDVLRSEGSRARTPSEGGSRSTRPNKLEHFQIEERPRLLTPEEVHEFQAYFALLKQTFKGLRAAIALDLQIWKKTSAVIQQAIEQQRGHKTPGERLDVLAEEHDIFGGPQQGGVTGGGGPPLPVSKTLSVPGDHRAFHFVEDQSYQGTITRPIPTDLRRPELQHFFLKKWLPEFFGKRAIVRNKARSPPPAGGGEGSTQGLAASSSPEGTSRAAPVPAAAQPAAGEGAGASPFRSALLEQDDTIKTPSVLQRYFYRIRGQFDAFVDMEKAAQEHPQQGKKQQSLTYKEDSKLTDKALHFLFALEQSLIVSPHQRKHGNVLELREILVRQLCFSLQEAFLWQEKHRDQLLAQSEGVSRAGIDMAKEGKQVEPPRTAASPGRDRASAPFLPVTVEKGEYDLFLSPEMWETRGFFRSAGSRGLSVEVPSSPPPGVEAARGGRTAEGLTPDDLVVKSMSSPFGSELRGKEEQHDGGLFVPLQYKPSALYQFLTADCQLDLTFPDGYGMIQDGAEAGAPASTDFVSLGDGDPAREQKHDSTTEFVFGFDNMWNAVLKQNVDVVFDTSGRIGRTKELTKKSAQWYTTWEKKRQDYLVQREAADVEREKLISAGQRKHHLGRGRERVLVEKANHRKTGLLLSIDQRIAQHALLGLGLFTSHPSSRSLFGALYEEDEHQAQEEVAGHHSGHRERTRTHRHDDHAPSSPQRPQRVLGRKKTRGPRNGTGAWLAVPDVPSVAPDGRTPFDLSGRNVILADVQVDFAGPPAPEDGTATKTDKQFYFHHSEVRNNLVPAKSAAGTARPPTSRRRDRECLQRAIEANRVHVDFAVTQLLYTSEHGFSGEAAIFPDTEYWLQYKTHGAGETFESRNRQKLRSVAEALELVLGIKFVPLLNEEENAGLQGGGNNKTTAVWRTNGLFSKTSTTTSFGLVGEVDQLTGVEVVPGSHPAQHFLSYDACLNAVRPVVTTFHLEEDVGKEGQSFFASGGSSSPPEDLLEQAFLFQNYYEESLRLNMAHYEGSRRIISGRVEDEDEMLNFQWHPDMLPVSTTAAEALSPAGSTSAGPAQQQQELPAAGRGRGVFGYSVPLRHLLHHVMIQNKNSRTSVLVPAAGPSSTIQLPHGGRSFTTPASGDPAAAPAHHLRVAHEQQQALAMLKLLEQSGAAEERSMRSALLALNQTPTGSDLCACGLERYTCSKKLQQPDPETGSKWKFHYGSSLGSACPCGRPYFCCNEKSLRTAAATAGAGARSNPGGGREARHLLEGADGMLREEAAAGEQFGAADGRSYPPPGARTPVRGTPERITFDATGKKVVQFVPQERGPPSGVRADEAACAAHDLHDHYFCAFCVASAAKPLTAEASLDASRSYVLREYLDRLGLPEYHWLLGLLVFSDEISENLKENHVQLSGTSPARNELAFRTVESLRKKLEKNINLDKQTLLKAFQHAAAAQDEVAGRKGKYPGLQSCGTVEAPAAPPLAFKDNYSIDFVTPGTTRGKQEPALALRETEIETRLKNPEQHEAEAARRLLTPADGAAESQLQDAVHKKPKKSRRGKAREQLHREVAEPVYTTLAEGPDGRAPRLVQAVQTVQESCPKLVIPVQHDGRRTEIETGFSLFDWVTAVMSHVRIDIGLKESDFDARVRAAMASEDSWEFQFVELFQDANAMSRYVVSSSSDGTNKAARDIDGGKKAILPEALRAYLEAKSKYYHYKRRENTLITAFQKTMRSHARKDYKGSTPSMTTRHVAASGFRTTPGTSGDGDRRGSEMMSPIQILSTGSRETNAPSQGGIETDEEKRARLRALVEKEQARRAEESKEKAFP